MLTEPSELNNATKPPRHSKVYERWMALLFVLGTAGFAFTIFYVLVSLYH
jgi:hypothetical protein